MTTEIHPRAPVPSNPDVGSGSEAEARALPSRPAQEGQTVFVAEDDPDLRIALAETLAEEGLRSVWFPTASSLLAALDGGVPDLIVTDLAMPGMSGAQLLRALRDDERWHHIQVIIMTGSNDTALPPRLDVPVVHKPDTEALLRTIRTIMGQRPKTATG